MIVVLCNDADFPARFPLADGREIRLAPRSSVEVPGIDPPAPQALPPDVRALVSTEDRPPPDPGVLEIPGGCDAFLACTDRVVIVAASSGPTRLFLPLGAHHATGLVTVYGAAAGPGHPIEVRAAPADRLTGPTALPEGLGSLFLRWRADEGRWSSAGLPAPTH